MKIITIMALILVILCQVEFLYLMNQNLGSADLLARILLALHKHDINLEGIEIRELNPEDDDDDEEDDE